MSRRPVPGGRRARRRAAAPWCPRPAAGSDPEFPAATRRDLWHHLSSKWTVGGKGLAFPLACQVKFCGQGKPPFRPQLAKKTCAVRGLRSSTPARKNRACRGPRLDHRAGQNKGGKPTMEVFSHLPTRFSVTGPTQASLILIGRKSVLEDL